VSSVFHIRTVYHALNPHHALSPVPDASARATIQEQHEKEITYCQLLVQGALAVLLPTEDLENVCLRTLVGDVLADLILDREVSGKACEGWFIWEAITKLIALIRQGNSVSDEVENIQKSRLERFGLLTTKEGHDGDDSPGPSQSYVSVLLWRTLLYSYLACVAIRFVVTGLFRVASSPSILIRGAVSASTPTTPINLVGEIPSWSNNSTARTPVLKYRVFGMILQLLDVWKRMPWLGGALALAQHAIVDGPGRLGETDGIFDK